MVMQIKNIMNFNGQWRSYQKRVLDHSAKYLNDKRVHIVASPGSGKTTLGIELIRRLNAPCLILAPSVNIRDQWLGRIREAFIPEGKEPEGLLSNNIRIPGGITAITYQAMHSGITRAKDGNETAEDYSDFDFFTTVKNAGIETICLDEAHHLRSEWWKVLEEMVGKLTGIRLISLTATPPYDSTPAQWERYIGLCGPIDEEIIVPELVKEGSLCPHQDYVYFNMPTADEENAVNKFTEDAFVKADALFRDEAFTRIISTHKGLNSPKEYTDLFIQKPEYLSALLVFLQAKNIVFAKELLTMLGTGTRLPAMTIKWMEILLQGFLYDDIQSYECTKEYSEKLKGSLKAHGLIQKNKVCLTANETINKLLTGSKGKINSILEITKAEYENLGGDLRLLILTDYIKKEYTQAVGDLEKGVNELGVIPIFESIRRTFSGVKHEKNITKSGNRITAGDLRIGVLSGSIVLIPQSAKPALEAALEKYETKATIKALDDIAFCLVNVVGTEITASRLVTDLFNQGEIRVLIGTKSLLGEGWDSPCINSLILASFVGSFMLSNQMRGRAIRVMKGNPDKVSNIWHLICMQPDSVKNKEMKTDTSKSSLSIDEETQDFTTLQRRFEGFLGVHYERNVIENGLKRLSYITGPYTAPLLEKINKQMLHLAADRAGLKKRWEDSLRGLDKMELVVEAGASQDFFKTGVSFYMALAALVVCGFLSMLSIIKFFPALSALLAGKSIIWSACKLIFWGIGGGLAGSFLGRNLSYMYRTKSPTRYMKAIGNCVLEALKRFGAVTTKEVNVSVEEAGEDGMSFIYMQGGSEREKDVFAQCVCEFFGVVDKQRYLLIAQRTVPKLCKYYCVPELFGKKKEDGAMFHDKVKRYIGNYKLVYTRSGEGKQTLLAAKVYSLVNKNADCICKKKTIKNA
ncbi:MAG TPA: DEAD/DEAH box helicase family protein [Lachnospiraceae bacterium]|nr:DEAD/DEAH box helicase family protein [Lachnospiraceae bacterium]